MIEERIEDSIVIATINHGRNNSITLDWLRQLRDIVNRVNSGDEFKGIVLTGAGRTFSSGFDLPMFLDLKDLNAVVAFFKEEEDILLDIFTCKKPVVAAINGSAVAGGMILAMACDWRIMKNHPKLKIGMSEIKIGLPLSVAQSRIMRFGLDSDRLYRDVMYLAEMYDVNQARAMGAIDEIVEEDKLITRAKEVVCMFMDQPGKAFMKLKEGLRRDTAAIIRETMKTEKWHELLKCFFDPTVRTTLDSVQQKMS
jgi:enoyl-CoA hydratase/carnithine racemase